MKKEYDFTKSKRGQVVSTKGKTRITMYLDTDLLEDFRERADKAGCGYQTMINEARHDLKVKEPNYDAPTTELFEKEINLYIERMNKKILDILPPPTTQNSK